MQTADGSLTPTPPFDFALSLRFLEGFSPAEGEQAIETAAVTKGLRTHGQTVVFRVEAADGSTPEAPELSYRLWSEPPLTDDVRTEAADRIGAFLSIDDDLTAFYERARADPVFAPIAARLHGLHQVRFLTPFENLCWAVMGQRAPIPVARKAKDAFVERYGGALEVDGVLHRAFPEPADVAGLTAADLMQTIGNRRRADYLANVIEAWQDVDETWLRTGPVDDVQARLRSIKGVGRVVDGVRAVPRVGPSRPHAAHRPHPQSHPPDVRRACLRDRGDRARRSVRAVDRPLGHVPTGGGLTCHRVNRDGSP